MQFNYLVKYFTQLFNLFFIKKLMFLACLKCTIGLIQSQSDLEAQKEILGIKPKFAYLRIHAYTYTKFALAIKRHKQHQ